MSKLIRFSTVLSEANSIIRSMRSYPKRRRTQRLYKQWAETVGLQPEVLFANAVKTKDASPQAVTADSTSTKLSEHGEDSIERSKGILREGSIPEHITDRIHDTEGVSTESNSHEEPHKVAMFTMAEINKEQLRLAILLVLLGASLVIFCLGVIMVIVYSFGL